MRSTRSINKLRGGRENTDIPPPTIAQRIQNVAGGIRLSTIKPTPDAARSVRAS